jgi:pimeloyl-ACP methyl ester carboxylesterase
MTFAESDVDVDGFQIRALTAGSGEPLVFIHGGGGLHLSKAHELLAERYRVIALEVPGFGNSAPNGRSGSFPELAATLVCAARKMGAERFKLWGTSFGGAVALWMAIGAPEAIETLVLEAPGAILPEGGIGAGRRPKRTWPASTFPLWSSSGRETASFRPNWDACIAKRCPTATTCSSTTPVTKLPPTGRTRLSAW